MFDIAKFLDDAALKLTSGTGSPDTGGCWMSVLSLYSGASWGDQPPCVCPVIRTLCIQANDSISSDAERGRILSDVLLEPVGTATDDAAVTHARMWHLVDAAIRRFVPRALRSAGLYEHADSLSGMDPVTAGSATHAAAYASRTADTPADYAADNAAAYAEVDAAARAAARTARTAADYAAANAAANAAARAARTAVSAARRAARAAAHAAAYAAAYAASAADYAAVDAAARTIAHAARAIALASSADAADRFIADVVLFVVLELCAVGARAPVDMACDESSFRKAVQCT